MSATSAAWIGGALLLFASMYLGTGWSLVLFQFPGALDSTSPDDFPVRFGGPVRRAVAFFAVQSTLMVAGGIAMTVGEWDHGGYRWAPLVYLVFTVAATAFTVIFILPVNRRLSATIGDPAEFRAVLGLWIRLNVIRTLLWTIEWIAIAMWFVGLSTGGRS